MVYYIIYKEFKMNILCYAILYLVHCILMVYIGGILYGTWLDMVYDILYDKLLCILYVAV